MDRSRGAVSFAMSISLSRVFATGPVRPALAGTAMTVNQIRIAPSFVQPVTKCIRARREYLPPGGVSTCGWTMDSLSQKNRRFAC